MAMARLAVTSAALGGPLFVAFQATTGTDRMGATLVAGIGLIAVLIGSAWSALVLQIQRLHDQGRGGGSAIAVTLGGAAAGPALGALGADAAVANALATAVGTGYLVWLCIARSRE